jgi:hypothetical protein
MYTYIHTYISLAQLYNGIVRLGRLEGVGLLHVRAELELVLVKTDRRAASRVLAHVVRVHELRVRANMRFDVIFLVYYACMCF